MLGGACLSALKYFTQEKEVGDLKVVEVVSALAIAEHALNCERLFKCSLRRLLNGG